MSSFINAVKLYVLKAIDERTRYSPELVPSEYWLDFARNFRYVYDLGEEELNRIRYHTYHLTSDSYLTYYFADESFKNLLTEGYRHFVVRNHLNPHQEGKDGIGVETEFGRISHDLLRYLGVISDLFNAGFLNTDTAKSVIEIGGGYGGLARAYINQNAKTTYFICDLEETIFFSAVYLSKHLGIDRVHMVEKTLKYSEIEPGHVYITPQSKIELLKELHFDYAISQQSLQEMTQTQVERYLEWMTIHVDHLYSCNILDHAALASTKHLVLNLPALLNQHFSAPVWQGTEPLAHEKFGDNHLLRAIYKCH